MWAWLPNNTDSLEENRTLFRVLDWSSLLWKVGWRQNIYETSLSKELTRIRKSWNWNLWLRSKQKLIPLFDKLFDLSMVNRVLTLCFNAIYRCGVRIFVSQIMISSTQKKPCMTAVSRVARDHKKWARKRKAGCRAILVVSSSVGLVKRTRCESMAVWKKKEA